MKTQKPVGNHLRRYMYDEAGTAISEYVIVSDESIKLDVADRAMEERAGTDEIGVVDVEFIGPHKDRKQVVYDMCDQLGMIGGQQRYSMA